jgi:quercetin dioxygenase-like cupin family protein
MAGNPSLLTQIKSELDRALQARAEGNEGMARVCARRAAGLAAGEYLRANGYPDPGASAYARLKYLCEIPDISISARQAANHLLLRVTPQHTLPLEIDLIAESNYLINALLHLEEKGEQMSQSYQFIANLAQEIPGIPDDSIISRTFYADNQVKAILFGFAPGQELSEHTASSPAILYFISGEASLTLGSDPQEAQPGTWVHMPANLPHSIRAKTPTAMLLIMLHAK